MFRSRRRARKFARILCVVSILTFSVGDFARADLVWDGDTDAVWATGNNWDTGSAPLSTDTAVFSDTSANVNGNTTIDLGGGGVDIENIVFDSGSAAAYTIGSGGAKNQTLRLQASGANAEGINMNSSVVADQTINANVVLGNASTQTYRFSNQSTTNDLIINGDISTGTGGTAGIVTLNLGNFTPASGDIIINGNIPANAESTRLTLVAAGADVTMNGTVSGTGNTMRTAIRNNGSITVGSSGSIGEGNLNLVYGTLNLNNTTTAQLFDDNITLGNAIDGDGNATINIASGGTLELDGGITYLDDDDTANTALISGGSLQITGASRTFTVHNNSSVASTSPELTISSDIINDGSDRDITIRGADGEAEGGTILLSGTNSSGAITLQSGTLQLGSNSALDTGGDFLTISARNAGATVANTVAIVDLMGTTNTVNAINIGNDSTTLIADNGFQGSIVDTVGGGALTDVDIIRVRNGTGTGIQRNGAAEISVDTITYDASGNSKQIQVEDGQATTDLTLTSNLRTAAGETDDDFLFFGDGQVSFTGTLGNDTTVGAHDDVDINTRKFTMGANTTIAGQDQLFVRQRNSATFGDFEVELDINGNTINLLDDLVVSTFTDSNILAADHKSTRITDTLGTGLISLDHSDAQVVYNPGTGSADGVPVVGANVTAFIEADISMNGGGRTFAVNDGASDIDLDMSGSILSDNGTRTLTKSALGTLRLSATDNTAGIGLLTIQAGRVIATNTGAIGTDDIQLGNDTTDGIFEYTGVAATINEQIRIGDNNAAGTRVGDGSIVNNGSGTLTFSQGAFNQARGSVTVARTLTLDGTSDIAISGSVIDNNTGGGGTVALTKNGTNTVNLSGNNAYTGATAVNAGQLNISGTNASTFTVAAGANLGGEGSTSGNLVFSGTTHNLTIDAATSAVLGSTGTGSTSVSALNVGGFTINVNNTASGPITVLTYGSGGFVGAVDRFVLGTSPGLSDRSGSASFVDDTAGNIVIDLGYADRTWNNSSTDGLWNEGVAGSTNWVEGDNLFYNSDSVFFNDAPAAAGPHTVNLAQNVTATNVTFDGTNTDEDYTLNDSGGGETLTISGTMTVSGGTATTNDGYDVTINTAIAGTGSLVVGNNDGVMDASQNSLTLTAANTYSGGSTLGEGRVSITNSSALGTGSVTITDGTGATNRDPVLDLDIASGFDVDNNFIILTDGGAKIIRFENGGTNTGTLSGTITNSEDAKNNFRLEVGDNETLTVSGLVSGTGGLATKGNPDNGATVVLSNAANSFTGPLVVGSNVEVASIANSGVASHAGAGSSIVLGISGGTGANPSANKRDGNLIYTGAGNSTDRQVQVGNHWFSAGQNHANGGSITNNGTGALTFANAQFSLQESRVAADIGARTLSLGGTYTGGINEIQGTILDNVATDSFVDETVALNVNGVTGSTWAISGANTYSGGTTVTSGTLLVNNTSGSGTGTGTVTVDAGATLGGTGIISGATTISGTHGPGTSPGIQTFGNDLTYNAGSNIDWELVTNTSEDTTGVAGTDFDQIVVGGNLVFNATTTLAFNFGGTVNFADGFWTTPGANHQWTIFSGGNGDPTNLAFNGNGQTAPGIFSFDTNAGDLVLNYTLAVPEASTFMLFSLGLGMFGFGRRRKKAQRV